MAGDRRVRGQHVDVKALRRAVGGGRQAGEQRWGSSTARRPATALRRRSQTYLGALRRRRCAAGSAAGRLLAFRLWTAARSGQTRPYSCLN